LVFARRDGHDAEEELEIGIRNPLAHQPLRGQAEAVVKEEGLSWQALGKMLLAVANLSSKVEGGTYVDSEDAMLSAAKDAVAIFEDLGATKGKTVAKQVVANCTLALDNPSSASEVAKAFMDKFFGVPAKVGLVALDVIAAIASCEGSYHKAYASTSGIMMIGLWTTTRFSPWASCSRPRWGSSARSRRMGFASRPLWVGS